MDSDIIFISLGTMLVGGIMLYAGFSNWNKFKKIADLSTSKARSMAAGLVELSGKVLPAKKLVSPITKQECTYYRVEHQIYMRGRRGGGSWVTTNTKTECENFFLEDDTGKVEVDPKLAEIDIPLDKIEYNRKFLGAKERDIEYVLAKGDVAYVLGTAKNKPGVKTAKNEDNFIVTQGEGDKFFYISDKSEKDVRSNLSTSAYLLIGLGALAVIGSFAYIVYSFFAV